MLAGREAFTSVIARPLIVEAVPAVLIAITRLVPLPLMIV